MSIMTSQKSNAEHVGTLFGIIRGDTKLTIGTKNKHHTVVHFENLRGW